MNFKEAAHYVLIEEGQPLSPKEITDRAFHEELITSKGKTPHATIAAVIYRDINQNGEESPFIKVDKGLFGLREWNEISEGESIELRRSSIPLPKIANRLKTSQLKSDSPAEFEDAIKDAFNLLGFEVELIGGAGDTDVLLIANIGQESFKITVDGKTSKSGKIIDRQIDWISLVDHKKKNKADFIIVVGPSFSGGNLQIRAQQYKVSLLTTDNLLNLIEAHSKFPFTLTELRDLFIGTGEVNPQLEDLLSQNHSRRNLLEQFRIIIEEMEALQSRLGYFSFDSLAGREKIEELEIETHEIDYIIKLLRLPFIMGIQEISEGKYILAISIKDISNIFRQLSNLLVEPEQIGIIEKEATLEFKLDKPKPERKAGSKYFNWYISGHSVVAEARKEKPYKHHCPIEHFKSILKIIEEAFQIHNLISTDLLFSMLEGKDLVPNRPFKGKREDYKIRMALGILEIEELINWTGSKRPIEYKLDVPIEEINKWFRKKILERT